MRKKRDASICFVGLDRAGKSTIVYRLRTGQFVDDISRTLGLTIDNLSVENFNLKTFDLGGQATFRRAIWQPYVELTNGICFVIDSIDKERYSLALEELYKTLKMTEKRVPLLVLLNKVDLIKEQLDMHNVITKENFVAIPLQKELGQFIGGFLHCLDIDFISNHASNFLVLGTSAKTGEGLKEAFEDFFVVELDNYLDLLESDVGVSTTVKDPIIANFDPVIKDYIPFAHPQLVLVIKERQIKISAKIGSLELDYRQVEEEFLAENERFFDSLRKARVSGLIGNLQYLLLSSNEFSFAVFGEVDDPFLAITDLTQDIINFLTQKQLFSSLSPEFKQLEEDLEQYLKKRYSSIPPNI